MYKKNTAARTEFIETELVGDNFLLKVTLVMERNTLVVRKRLV